MLREDVEDEGDPVDDLDLHDVLEPSSLAGSELRVDDDRIRPDRVDDVAQLAGLAAAQVGPGVGLVALLQHPVEDGGARGLCQRGELAEARLRLRGATLTVESGEDDLFQTQLSVLDLGDVFEFGRQTAHPPQRGPVEGVQLRRLIVRDASGVQRRGPSEDAVDHSVPGLVAPTGRARFGGIRVGGPVIDLRHVLPLCDG